jgi:site-specific recombinase XerD
MQQSFAINNNLFDTLETWQANPQLAYSSWLSKKNFKNETKELYQWMFGRFLRFLDSKQVDLRKVELTHIRAFLDTPNDAQSERLRRVIGSRARQQYVRNLEKVFDHFAQLAQLDSASANPARIAGVRCVVGGQDKPTRFLTREERAGLLAFIKTRLDVLRNAKHEENEALWLEIRDLALVCMAFGAGMKVGDLERMKLCCMDFDLGKPFVDLSRNGKAHRAHLLEFAIEPLRLWKTTLLELGDDNPNQALFIAKKVGFGERSKSPTLSASSIFRRIERLLAHAGISGHRASPQTLRNTYAAMLIEQKASLVELSNALGLSSIERASQLRRAYRRASRQV